MAWCLDPDWGQKHNQTKQKVEQNQEKMLSCFFSLLTRSAVHCHLEILNLENRRDKTWLKIFLDSEINFSIPRAVVVNECKKKPRNFISKEYSYSPCLKPCLKYFLFQQNLMMINEGWRHVSTTKNFEQITFFCEFLTGSHPATAMTWTKFHPRSGGLCKSFSNTGALY